MKADADFDFSQYDFDGDGYISAWDELAVFIVVPQTSSAGFVRNLWSGTVPQDVDGVYLDLITEWYTSDPVGDYYLGTHEVGHQLLMLSDLYRKFQSVAQVGTEPGVYCLMDQNNWQIAQHLNPAYKLALGWITPRIITQDTAISLEDVKVSREVVILPRSPGKAHDEFVVLENRTSPPNNARYDFNPASPSGTSCQAPLTARFCLHARTRTFGTHKPVATLPGAVSALSAPPFRLHPTIPHFGAISTTTSTPSVSCAPRTARPAMSFSGPTAHNPGRFATSPRQAG